MKAHLVLKFLCRLYPYLSFVFLALDSSGLPQLLTALEVAFIYVLNIPLLDKQAERVRTPLSTLLLDKDFLCEYI